MDREPGDQRRASLRASDADREQFVEQLRQHHAEGRLTLEELTERTGRAYAARTLGDLDALATDLPPAHAIGPAAAARRRRRASRAPPGLPPRRRPPALGGPRPRRTCSARLMWYGMLSVVLLVVWAMSGRDYFWPIWPILGFALLLGWQAFNLLGPRARGPGRRRARDR